jgi:hypothetical protein
MVVTNYAVFVRVVLSTSNGSKLENTQYDL